MTPPDLWFGGHKECVEYDMPKLKSNRGAAKRFRATAGGYKHRQANRNHILTKKSSKRKRHLRGLEDVAPADVARVRQMLPTKSR